MDEFNNIINSYSSSLWIVVGVVLLFIEFIVGGIGLLFLGLGGLTNAILLYNYQLLSMSPYVSFGLLSFVWFALLWRPLKHYVSSNNHQKEYINMIGDEVIVYKHTIISDKIGQVKWSGTIMNAKLDDKTEKAIVGEVLYIKNINGNILICTKDTNIK